MEGRGIPRDASNATIRQTLSLLAKTKPTLLDRNLFGMAIQSIRNENTARALELIIQTAQSFSKTLPQKMLRAPRQTPLIKDMKPAPQQGMSPRSRPVPV